MTTPNIDIQLPVTYVGTIDAKGYAQFTIAGSTTDKPAVPFTGTALVKITAATKGRPAGAANRGSYNYTVVAPNSRAVGSESSWALTYEVVNGKGQNVQAYPYFDSNNTFPADVGKSVAVTFFPMGEHKN